MVILLTKMHNLISGKNASNSSFKLFFLIGFFNFFTNLKIEFHRLSLIISKD